MASTAPPAPPTARGNSQRVNSQRVNSERVLLWTLLIVFILNFLDRSIVAILAEPIKRDLGLSDTQIGLMGGLAFALFYATLGLPIARYVDRPASNRVNVIAGSMVVWSIMTAVCGSAQNFTQMLLARIGVGVGEAGCTPAAHSLISDCVPVERRASAMAFYGLGVPIGGLLGVLIGGFLADTLGWRSAFLVAGLPGVLMAILVWRLLRDPRHAAADVGRPAVAVPFAVQSTRAALASLLTNRAYVLLTLAAGMTAFLGYGKGLWVLVYFQRSLGLSAGEVGLYAGVSGGIAGLLGTWGGGWLADRFGRRNRRHILTAPAIGMAVAAPLLFLAYGVGNWQSAVALLFIPTALNSLYYGPTFAAAQMLVPPQTRAVATATVIFVQSFIGLGLGPLFFGMLSDYFEPVAGAASVQWVLFGAAWLGLVPAFFFWRASLRLDAAITATEASAATAATLNVPPAAPAT
jgi:MFS family permease